MTLRRLVIGAFIAAALCAAAPASAQSAPSSSTAPATSSPRTRPAPAAFLWIPLILVAGSVYAVRVFIQPVSRRDRESA